MPTPAGDITGSNIWTGEPSEDKKYKVTVTYKIRRVMLVSAKSAAEAEGFVIDTINQNPTNEDVLISEYQSLVEEE